MFNSLSCSDIAACYRQDAEYLGYGSASTSEILIVVFSGFCIIATIMVVLSVIQACCCKRKLVQNADAYHRVELVSVDESNGGRSASRHSYRDDHMRNISTSYVAPSLGTVNPSLGTNLGSSYRNGNISQIEPIKKKPLIEVVDVDSAGRVIESAQSSPSSSSAEELHLPHDAVLAPDGDGGEESASSSVVLGASHACSCLDRCYDRVDPSNRCIANYFPHISIVVGTLVLISMIVTILFYPLVPQFSVCNDKIHWDSILYNLLHLQLRADVELHMSLYNPNRFDLAVESVKATIMFSGESVATGMVTNKIFEAGSIRDVVIPAVVNPSAAALTVMLANYQMGKLLVDASLDIVSQVRAMSTTLYNVNTTMPVGALDLAGEVNRRLCKCDP